MELIIFFCVVVLVAEAVVGLESFKSEAPGAEPGLVGWLLFLLGTPLAIAAAYLIRSS